MCSDPVLPTTMPWAAVWTGSGGGRNTSERRSLHSARGEVGGWDKGSAEKCQILDMFSVWSQWALLSGWMLEACVVGRERSRGVGPEDLEFLINEMGKPQEDSTEGIRGPWMQH